MQFTYIVAALATFTTVLASPVPEAVADAAVMEARSIDIPIVDIPNVARDAAAVDSPIEARDDDILGGLLPDINIGNNVGNNNNNWIGNNNNNFGGWGQNVGWNQWNNNWGQRNWNNRRFRLWQPTGYNWQTNWLDNNNCARRGCWDNGCNAEWWNGRQVCTNGGWGGCQCW